jgi:tRNA pseudouridine32 synthase/23S rRNA pseudouridine746 synthase
MYADKDLLVLDKPGGLLSVPGRGDDKQDCLSHRAQLLYPDALVVHRLDMATSGLVVMARGHSVQRALNDAFAARNVYKRYEAVVYGSLMPSGKAWQLIDLPIALDWANRPRRVIDAQNGKHSSTRWQTLEGELAPDTTRVTLEPITGRSHQLRVHLQAIGHPILGDQLYGQTQAAALSERLMLHACELAFIHPSTRQTIRFVSRPPF